MGERIGTGVAEMHTTNETRDGKERAQAGDGSPRDGKFESRDS